MFKLHINAKKLVIALAMTLAACIAGALLVYQNPSFGGKISGERIQAMSSNPYYQDGRFINSQAQSPRKLSALGVYIKKSFFYDEIRVPPIKIPVVEVSKDLLAKPDLSGFRMFWIGHASVYFESNGLRLLIDPIFSDYAAPFNFGPKRFHPPPINLQDLPVIDAVLISHDHYDHLDMETSIELSKKGTMFFVPLGVGVHLEKWGIARNQIREMQWWEKQMIGELEIYCTPARHYSGRRLNDTKATFWSSWAVVGPTHRVYYSGDTGYSNHFIEIGERLGPFDVSFMKIGAYGPGDSWLDIHMTPEQAVQAHVDLQARRMLPVHWGTFNLAFHDWDEPIKRAVEAAKNNDVDLVTPRPGEIIDLEPALHSESWWELLR